MGIGKYITRRTFPEGNFQNIRATSPSQRDYNIRATEDLVRNVNPFGFVGEMVAPAAAGVMSLPYDAMQAGTRVTENDINRAMGTAGMSGPKDMMAEAYGLAYDRENPLLSAYERMVGASAPLADRINNLNIGSAEASIPTRDDMIKAGIVKQMLKEGTATPMARRTYGNMSMGQGKPDWVADRSPVSQGLKEIEIGMAPFVANRIPSQQDLASDFFINSIKKDSKFYDPYKPTFRDQIKQGLNKYAKPVMSGIMSAFSGIPGMGLLMNAFQKDPYAQNRIDMYGAYRDPSTGFMKDKFGYNVGNTLMKNRFLEPGSNSYRSYALDAMRGMDKAGKRPALDNYYQKTYGKTWDQVKKDHQKKQNPFGDPTLGGYSGSDAGFAASQQTGGWNDQGGPVSNKTGKGRTGWSQGGIVSLWRR